MAQQLKQVGVLGAGLMGHGIAQVAAQSGYEVVLREVDKATLQKGIGKIEKQLARAVEKGKSSQEDADAVRGRIKGTIDYKDLADCDLVIEAITESLALKLEMWKELDGIVKPEAVFATNTSSLAVIDQAAATSRPTRFVGLHYFNPAQVMKLVEVVRCVTTSDEAFAVGLEFAQSEGKLAIWNERSGGVHRQPAAGAVHARRDARVRRGRGLGERDRRGDEGRRGASDGSPGAVGLRRVGHARLDLRRALRRVPRAALRAPAGAAQDAERGLVRTQVGYGLLRLLR